jgi:hypothetical protein
MKYLIFILLIIGCGEKVKRSTTKLIYVHTDTPKNVWSPNSIIKSIDTAATAAVYKSGNIFLFDSSGKSSWTGKNIFKRKHKTPKKIKSTVWKVDTSTTLNRIDTLPCKLLVSNDSLPAVEFEESSINGVRGGRYVEIGKSTYSIDGYMIIKPYSFQKYLDSNKNELPKNIIVWLWKIK